MTFRIALVQPETDLGADGRQANLDAARRHVLAAAAGGASLVLFPESFPGAWRSPVSWTPLGEMCEMAREAGIYVVGGYAEPLDASGVRCYNTLSLVGPDGVEVGRYRRTTPAHAPWVYLGGPFWDFDWVNAAELPVFETDLGKIGLLICSEVFAPELARILALKGAELILLPAGLMGAENPLFDTWRTLVRARAIENLACTAMCSNVIAGQGGLAMVCSPEDVVLEAHEPGLHFGEVDLDRVAWLRAKVDNEVGPAVTWRTKPGTLRDWRRVEVFERNPELVMAPDSARSDS